jgi:hypothetical protein
MRVCSNEPEIGYSNESTDERFLPVKMIPGCGLYFAPNDGTGEAGDDLQTRFLFAAPVGYMRKAMWIQSP